MMNLITLLPLARSFDSGSAPTRPTIVMRAIRFELVVANVRVSDDGRVVALRRAGVRRKDMVMVLIGMITS